LEWKSKGVGSNVRGWELKGWHKRERETVVATMRITRGLKAEEGDRGGPSIDTYNGHGYNMA